MHRATLSGCSSTITPRSRDRPVTSFSAGLPASTLLRKVAAHNRTADADSEIGRWRARDGKQNLLRVLDRREGFALGADHLFHRRLIELLITLACRPGHRE